MSINHVQFQKGLSMVEFMERTGRRRSAMRRWWRRAGPTASSVGAAGALIRDRTGATDWTTANCTPFDPPVDRLALYRAPNAYFHCSFSHNRWPVYPA